MLAKSIEQLVLYYETNVSDSAILLHAQSKRGIYIYRITHTRGYRSNRLKTPASNVRFSHRAPLFFHQYKVK